MSPLDPVSNVPPLVPALRFASSSRLAAPAACPGAGAGVGASGSLAGGEGADPDVHTLWSFHVNYTTYCISLICQVHCDQGFSSQDHVQSESCDVCI